MMKRIQQSQFLIKIVSIVMLSILFIGICFVAPLVAEEKPISMTIVCECKETDGGWGTAHWNGYLYLKKQYPELKLTYIGDVPFAENVSVVQSVGESGVDICYISTGLFEAVQMYANRYPHTWWVMMDIYEGDLAVMPDNVTTVVTKDEEGSYLAGVAAGMVTKTNKIGFISGFEYAMHVRSEAAYLLGARSVNPKVKLSRMFTGSWTDVEKGYEAGRAMIDSGVDVIIADADAGNYGILRAAGEAGGGVYFIGKVNDRYELAPDWIITSILVDHRRAMEESVRRFKEGILKKEIVEFGLADGWDTIAPLTNVSEEVKAKVEEAKKAIIEGKIKVPVIIDPVKLEELLNS
jgi:basic membrane lipoprotein Med (substrate-binding protein (PBP1-ABC) superfamily)